MAPVRGESRTRTPRRQAASNELNEKVSKDELLKRLKSLAQELSEAEQAEDLEPPELKLYKSAAHSLGKEFIVKHKDKDIRQYAASCLADILRIFAPDAPYDRNQIWQIFSLMIKQLRGLAKPKSASYKCSFHVLENLALVKSFNICVTLEFQDLIGDLFHILFDAINDDHSNKVHSFMLDIMVAILTEEESVPKEHLEILLDQIRPSKEQKPAAVQLAVELIKKTSASIQPAVQSFFNSALTSDSEISKDICDLILELNRISSTVLLAVLPQLEYKLKSTDVNERLQVTKLLATMFSDENSELAEQNKPLWRCYLGRFVDIAVEVRLECVNQARDFLCCNSDLAEHVQDKLHERQRDPDDRVRHAVVSVICSAALKNVDCISDKLLDDIQERMRDKKWLVRKEAMMGLGNLYKRVTTSSNANPTAAKRLSWVPSRVLHCYYQNTIDDRLCVERLVNGCLVPATLETDERMKRLLTLYSKLDDHALKVRADLKAIVNHQCSEETSEQDETRRKLISLIIPLAKALPDPFRAQEHLKKLHSMLAVPRLKEHFQTIVSPDVECPRAFKAAGDIMTEVGFRNPIAETIRALVDRAAPLLVDSDAVKELMKLIKDSLDVLRDEDLDSDLQDELVSRSQGKKGLVLLIEMAKVFPAHFQNSDSYEQLLVFLKDKDSEIVDAALKILSHVGGEPDSSLLSCFQTVLSTFVTRGTPLQAKYAVRSLRRMFEDKPSLFDRIFTNLVESLKRGEPMIHTTLTSLGEMALHLPSLFETKHKDIVREFVVKDLLMKDLEIDSESESEEDDDWCEDCEVSQETRLKVCGVKLLVKWLRGTEANQSTSISATPVLNLLDTLLRNHGDLQAKGFIRKQDQSRLRLAAACAMLKIAQGSCYDKEITVKNFQTLALTMQDVCFEVREEFTRKLHKALDNLKLPLEYLGIFTLAATDPSKERKTQVKQMLLKNVLKRRECIKHSSAAAVHSQTFLPEYALPHVIHLLAHHPDFDATDVYSLDQQAEYLWFFLEPVMAKAENFSLLKKLVDKIKQSKDAFAPDDKKVNERLFTVCDLAAGVLTSKTHTIVLKDFPGLNPVLPTKLFTPGNKNETNIKIYLPKGYTFSSMKVHKQRSLSVDAKPSSKPSKTAHRTTTNQKTSHKTAANQKTTHKASANQKTAVAKRSTRGQTQPSKRQKQTFKEMANKMDVSTEESGDEISTEESGIASPLRQSPGKRRASETVTRGSPSKKPRLANVEEKKEEKKPGPRVTNNQVGKRGTKAIPGDVGGKPTPSVGTRSSPRKLPAEKEQRSPQKTNLKSSRDFSEQRSPQKTGLKVSRDSNKRPLSATLSEKPKPAAKRSLSPPKSPNKKSPFKFAESPGKSSTTVKKSKGKKVAARRNKSELDSVPEDVPSSSTDGGKPCSPRKNKAKSALNGALGKESKRRSPVKESPSKKRKTQGTKKQASEQTVLNIKRKNTRRR